MLFESFNFFGEGFLYNFRLEQYLFKKNLPILITIDSVK